MRVVSKAGLGAAAIVGVLAFGTSAHAYLSSFTIDATAKCKAAKIKTVGKIAAAYAGCHSKGAAKGLATDPVCLGKASTKLTAAFGKLDLKPPCATSGDGAARDTDTANYAAALDAAVGHGMPLANGKCDGAKTKTVGKYVAAIMGCYSKAAAKAPGTVSNGPGSCTDKALVKLSAAIAKIELKPPCTTSGNAGALTTQANNFIDTQACLLAPGNPGCGGTCGNGANDPGEDCDPSTAPAGWATCGADFTCSGSCTCDCPNTVTFSGDATAPESILDTGWTGISHRAPVISNGDVSITLSCAASSRPCGTCPVSGPVANPDAGAGQIDNRRCSNDSSIKCTNDGMCPGGTCEYYFGAPLPLAAGGVTTCVYNQFDGNITGTANVESGEATTTAFLTATVYNGIAIDNPCPRCTDAGGINDGVNGGTCDSGTRVGLPCDANGFVPNRPSFGRTSLDCPLASGGIIATLPINLTNETNPVTKTLTASSPNCGPSAPGQKCLCQTCNNAAATPCFSNADCVAVGATVCGGNRCIGGANNGNPCTVVGDCPGGLCNRAGEPTRPSACLDDTATVGIHDCVDTGPVDGEGECTAGPITQNCSVASGFAQRGCTGDVDCGGGIGSCQSANRLCFLTGGGTFQPFQNGKDGSDVLTAVGMEDTPVQDVSNPVLGAVFCVGPTGSASVNNVAGLPGPARITLTGTAVGHE